MEQNVIFTGDIYYTQHFPDPCLPFQGRNDKEELFMQPCLGECLHFSLISTPVASSVQRCSLWEEKHPAELSHFALMQWL